MIIPETDEKPMVRVMCSGFFDPIHEGHIECFEKAKDLGDWLIVVVNNDKQARLKKGQSFMSEKTRMKIIESLWMVDEVILSIDEDMSICKTLELVRPDIFAKGGDRTRDNIPETIICDKLNIKIVDGLGEKINSSSKIIQESKQ